jgi:hypothetical protein
MNMPALKGQSDIVGAVIIVLIAIALVGIGFGFGLPLIEKNQDRGVENRVNSFFDPANTDSLSAKIKAVANSGGREEVRIDVEGVTRLYPSSFSGPEKNSIEFTFQSRVSRFAVNEGWISVSGTSCPPAMGAIGTDEPVAVCVKADNTGGGVYNITYRLQMRELEDALKRNGLRINLVQHPASSVLSSGSATSVRIEVDSRRQENVGGKNLITADVKILLV